MGDIYRRPEKDSPFHQCEVVSDVWIYLLDPLSPPDERTFTKEGHPFAMILTPECDLEQDWNARAKDPVSENQCVGHVLLVDAFPISDLKKRFSGDDLWKPVRQNKNERFQTLEAIPAEDDALGEGVACIGLDFKRVFSIPMAELRTVPPKRRAYLCSPYRDHLAFRFAAFSARVGLPRDHNIVV